MKTILESLRTYFRPAETTLREMGECVSEERVDQVLAKLAVIDYKALVKVCYVFGAGGRPRSIYTGLSNEAGVHVIHFESVLPQIPQFVPSYRGLVKIEGPAALWGVLTKLMEQSTAIVLIFDTALEKGFIESVRNLDQHGDCSFGIKQDAGYLIYLVDEDRHDSPTGIVHFLSYVKDGPWKYIFPECNE